MSVQNDTQANFCPQCGAPLDATQFVATDEDLVAQGVFERAGAHLVVEGGSIKIYKHKGDRGGDGA